ncbi:uncharacterized protein EV420DRAFT_1246074, partial [Desarmillaria tabescens]
MKAFIKCILGYSPDEFHLKEGVLGITKAYYGCVEVQGHGTLHCHMLVWLVGGLDPNEIKERILEAGDDEFKDRLFRYLDDSLSNYIPDLPMECDTVLSDGFHAASVCRDDVGIMDGKPDLPLVQQDLHNLVIDCQVHKHAKTCYKYCPYPLPKVCRFDLDADNINLETYFDYEKGELCLWCLDGLVNNFNETILCAVQCNMDIKFIGSRASAKAVLYYVTNYITKSQLKTHVTYAALELSVKKLGEYDLLEDEITVRAKRLLQRCAYAMLSHQELSAQQVSSYLMEYEDHFTSHEFQGLYWTSFESYIKKQMPSPECKPLKEGEDDLMPDHENDDTDTEEDYNNAVQVDDVVLADEEVLVELDDFGWLMARGSHVSDYVMQGPALKDV